MGCEVTFHDHVGRDQLAAAIEPMRIDELNDLLESAVGETLSAAIGLQDCEVELTLCSDAEMERLNFDHMGERSPTDVLAFPLHEWSLDGSHSHLADDDGISPPGATLLGDVVIDLDQAVRQASAGDWSVPEEIVLLAIHGSLHLVGHDHAEMDEEQRMRGLEHDVLAALHRRHHEVAWKPGSLFDRAGHAVTTGS
ncbi:MAG TPA: rRNA maturation RNase YbeY [Candidatus Limnocylindria bacterium]|jgi:probable rRNA maturation factor|nr:rRNA maturation RNase YbeY [Candidatus Limnocylindria bacterium]